MLTTSFKFLSKSESERLLNSIHHERHKLIALLMLDAGLRVSEACTLRLGDFDFKNRMIKVKSLKKRAKTAKTRLIPLSNRLYQALAEFLKTIKNYNPLTPLFKGCGEREFISRQAVWLALKKYQKKLGFQPFSPHSLRHSFATHHLADGTTLEQIKTMLGHERFDTTLVYAQVPTEQLKERVNSVTTKPVSKWKQWLSLSPKKQDKVINLNFSKEFFTIGRNEEIANLEENADKGINTILKGSIGVGKSHLLDVFETERKVLRLDDTESIKKSLAGILLYLHNNDKKAALQLIWKDFEKPEIEKRIQRETTVQLCDLIISSTKPKEYILLIDDISRITPSGRKVLERMKDHFTIIAGARQIKANDSSFLWNFEVVEIKPLKRHFAMTFINQLSSGMEIENWELYRNHIFNQTNGNPRAIFELVERFKKEPFLTNEIVREVRHMGALKEVDMTWVIILFLGVVMATRYMAGEMQTPALKFIGGIAMILLLMFRPLQRMLQRKFI